MRISLSLALFLFLASSSSYACHSPAAAIESYYGGYGEKISTTSMGGGLYSISYFDSERGAICTGGIARVNGDCTVEPVQELFCN